MADGDGNILAVPPGAKLTASLDGEETDPLKLIVNKIKALHFLQRRGNSKKLQEVDTLYIRDVFYVKVKYNKKPKEKQQKVTLTFSNGETNSVNVTAGGEDALTLSSSPKYLEQLSKYPETTRRKSAPRESTPAPATDKKKPKEELHKMTVKLSCEETLEGPPTKGSRFLIGEIDDVNKKVSITLRGETKRATLDIPLELTSNEEDALREKDDDDALYLKVGGYNLQIDEGLPEA